MSTSAPTTSPSGPRSSATTAAAGRGVDDQRVDRAEPGARRDVREAAHPVAAHLGGAAVGVAQRHRAVGAVGTGEQREQAVGSDAAVAVAERGGRRASSGSGVWCTRKSLPVACSFARCSRSRGATRASRAPQLADDAEQRLRIAGRTQPGDARVAPEPHALTACERGCAAPRDRARPRAWPDRRAGTRALRGSRSPAPRSATARRAAARAPRPRRPDRRRAWRRPARRCVARAPRAAATPRSSAPRPPAARSGRRRGRTTRTAGR